tara:strand:+ start:694 stop:1923 length:1230 start_codon:yes stop_codon:yes gene_type:complete
MAETFETSIPRFVDRLAKLSMEDVALSKNRDKFIQEEIREKVKIGNRLFDNNIYTKDFFDKAIKDRRRELAEEANPLGARSGRATMLVGGQAKLDKNNSGSIDAEDFKILRASKQKGGGVAKIVTLDTILFEDDKERKITVRSALGSSRPEEVFGYIQTGNKEFLRSGVEDYANEGRPDAYTYIYPPGEMPDDVAKLRLERLNSIIRSGYKINRTKKVKGGGVETQMEMMLGEEEAPMVSDEQMEEDYVDYVIEETLSNQDRNYLIDALEKDDRLSEIFDQVVESATEFTGSGPVEGPGTGKSDSIPARLSDGEFVFTAKATKEIGVDNLMSMMKSAEAQADERLQAQEGGMIEEEETVTMPVEMQPVQQDIRVTKETVGSQATMQEQSDLIDEELKKSMLSTRPYVRS